EASVQQPSASRLASATPRRRALAAACAVPLAAPTVLAFFSGGFFAEARVWAGLVAWALVAGCAVAGRAVPRARSARVAVASLVALGCWTLASIAWAPIAGSAWGAGQLVLLYAGALIAATGLLGTVPVRRLVEPALAAGVLVVIGYGISERLVPGLLHFARSVSAQGRLEQPLTYWNAMGELAALGFVLSTRISGDRTRPAWCRVAAAAACAPLGLGVYLSFSRGALFACAAGLVALVVLAPTREQARAIALALAAAVLASLGAAGFGGVTSLAGSLSARERDGAIVLVLLVAIATAAALVRARLLRRDAGERLRLPRRAPAIAVALVCAGFALAVAVGAHESSAQPLSGGASRYETLESNRYAYWDVALQAFVAQPLHGVGAGGWAVWWLRHRTVNEGAQDAHSLELQTLAELGLVGAALLAALFAAVAVAARGALRARPELAAGPIAGIVVYVAHSPLDWDWQMPAVTLVAVALAGLLLALSGPAAPID
ncbi:MAG: O-antigen ligase family protein, partial [Solirubrobacteraceae bacterium]